MTFKHFLHDPVTLVADALRSFPLTLHPPLLMLTTKLFIGVRFKGLLPLSRSFRAVAPATSRHSPPRGPWASLSVCRRQYLRVAFYSDPRGHRGQGNVRRGILVTVMNYTGDVLNFELVRPILRPRIWYY